MVSLGERSDQKVVCVGVCMWGEWRRGRDRCSKEVGDRNGSHGNSRMATEHTSDYAMGGRYHYRSLHLIDENAGGTSLAGLLCVLHGEGIPNL